MSVFAPFNPVYASATPYLTLAEFKNAPTSLNLKTLVIGGNQAAQDQALEDAISRASSWIDGTCHQVLAATVDIDQKTCKVTADGTIRFPLKYKPVLEIKSIGYGYPGKQSSFQTLDASDFADLTFLENGVIEFPIPSCMDLRYLVRVTYVNGFVNTTTVGASTVGATSCNVQSAAGIYPGTPVTLADGANTESATVANTYVPGSLTIPWASPLLYSHATGVAATNLPPAVKQAAILLTSAIIQARGDEALILDSTTNPRSSEMGGVPAKTLDIARELLRRVTRVA